MVPGEEHKLSPNASLHHLKASPHILLVGMSPPHRIWVLGWNTRIINFKRHELWRINSSSNSSNNTCSILLVFDLVLHNDSLSNKDLV